MSTSAPQYHRFRMLYPNDTVFGGQDNARLPYNTIATDYASGVEIGPGSEVDCMLVKHHDGSAVVSIGAPLVGKLRGPFHILPWAGRVPNGYTQFQASRCSLQEKPPLCEVIVHPAGCPPTLVQTRRAPSMRSSKEITPSNAYAANAPIDVFPFYGRRRATITLVPTVVGAGDLVVKVFGLRARTAFTLTANRRDSQDYGISNDTNESTGNFDMTALVLDSAGNIELTFTVASVSNTVGGRPSISIADETFHALAVFAKTAGADWTVIATCEASD